jgi:hypothetical protein
MTNSDGKAELKAVFRCWPCSLIGKSLVSGASVEMKIKFVSLNPDVCIFSFNDYVVFAKLLIKIVHLYFFFNYMLHIQNIIWYVSP